jgi:hypothetical protein
LDYLLAAELIEIGDREIGFDIECGDKMEWRIYSVRNIPRFHHASMRNQFRQLVFFLSLFIFLLSPPPSFSLPFFSISSVSSGRGDVKRDWQDLLLARSEFVVSIDTRRKYCIYRNYARKPRRVLVVYIRAFYPIAALYSEEIGNPALRDCATNEVLQQKHPDAARGGRERGGGGWG